MELPVPEPKTDEQLKKYYLDQAKKSRSYIDRKFWINGYCDLAGKKKPTRAPKYHHRARNKVQRLYDAGWSQPQIAGKFGLHASYISLILRDKRLGEDHYKRILETNDLRKVR